MKKSEVLDFKSCVNNCQMEDMKASGSLFTWNNKQCDEASVFSIID